MKVIKYFIVLLLIVTSCKDIKESHDVIMVPDIIERKADLELSDIFPDFSYIQLESNTACYINRVDEIIVDENFILIYDRDNQKLLQFDSEGRFKGNFMDRGRGPGEFISIGDIDVNENRELLILRSGQYLDIKTYDGANINTIKLTVTPMDAKWVNPEVLVLFYPFPRCIYNNGFEITFINREGEVLGNELPQSTKIQENTIIGRRFIGWNKGSLYYWLNRRDTVYTITKNLEVLPRVVFQHDERAIPIEKTSNDNYVFDFGNKYLVNHYSEFGDFVFVHAYYKNHGIRCVINEKLGICGDVIKDYNKYSSQGLLNDVDGGKSFWVGSVQIDGSLINVVDPLLLLEVFEHNKKNKVMVDPAKHAQLMTIIDDINLLSNPVLMRVEK